MFGIQRHTCKDSFFCEKRCIFALVRKIFFLILLGCAVVSAGAQTARRIGVEVRPVYVVPTHRFLSGENLYGAPIDRGLSFHLNYAFQRPDHPWAPTAYQGVGISHHRFFYAYRPELPEGFEFDRNYELGTPTTLYLFQGARIARLGARLSLNYEWNFGLSFGWHRYDPEKNPFNKVIGSRVNAYLNTNLYLLWRASPTLDLALGGSAMHFSNGSTRLPNAGLNALGITFGAIRSFDRPQIDPLLPKAKTDADFQRYMSYEVMLFGAWRRKGVVIDNTVYGSPHIYGVGGFNFAAMRNLGRKVRLGASLDGVYDGSANVYVIDQGDGLISVGDFRSPSWRRQWALGLAGQVDYVMPYFTLTFGLGANVLHGGGELSSFYQKLALKIDLTHNTFLHIGYSLREFRAPNFLMLGAGFRFD